MGREAFVKDSVFRVGFAWILNNCFGRESFKRANDGFGAFNGLEGLTKETSSRGVFIAGIIKYFGREGLEIDKSEVFLGFTILIGLEGFRIERSLCRTTSGNFGRDGLAILKSRRVTDGILFG